MPQALRTRYALSVGAASRREAMPLVFAKRVADKPLVRVASPLGRREGFTHYKLIGYLKNWMFLTTYKNGGLKTLEEQAHSAVQAYFRQEMKAALRRLRLCDAIFSNYLF